MKNERGVVYLEMLIGFLPTFLFFLGTLQVADASVAHLVVEHAATTAARAAVVVLPDDGAYYDDDGNALVHRNADQRQADVERAAETILAANPRLGLGAQNVALDKPAYADRELVTARVTARYRCLVALFCPGGLDMSASAQLVYQGARYVYEPSIGWASNALSNAASRARGNRKSPDAPSQDPAQDPNGTRPNDSDRNPDDPASDSDPNPADGEPIADRGDPSDRTPESDPTHDRADDRDRTPPRNVNAMRNALPQRLRNVPIVRDPSLNGSTVRVHYTRDDRGVITGIEVRVGDGAEPRHVADHARTIRVMQRYQGVSGRARAVLRRVTNWLTGHPDAGPGTLAWETQREIEKLNDLIDARTRALDGQELTPEQRAELERELETYQEQLARYEATVDRIAGEPGRGYVAANSQADEYIQKNYIDKGRTPPKLPDGMHWRLQNGELVPVRNPGKAGELPKKKLEDGEVVDDDGSRPPSPRFPENTTARDALDQLKKNSLGPYLESLRDAGIIQIDAEVEALLDGFELAGATHDQVRHAIKQHYREQVMNHLTSGGSPAENHRRMLEFTRGLNSGDRGSIAEDWYERTMGAAEATQVSVTQDQVPAMSGPRRLDRVNGTQIEEIKNVSGSFGDEVKKQIEDQLTMLGEEISVNGRSVEPKTHRLIMLDPRGTAANAGFIRDKLQRHPGQFSVEVWLPDGTRKTIKSPQEFDAVLPLLGS